MGGTSFVDTWPYSTPKEINACAKATKPSPATVSNGRKSREANSAHFNVMSCFTVRGKFAVDVVDVDHCRCGMQGMKDYADDRLQNCISAVSPFHDRAVLPTLQNQYILPVRKLLCQNATGHQKFVSSLENMTSVVMLIRT